jgi:prephenate dehydrogenase
MWRDIALANRDAILEAMDAVSREHDQLRTLIAERAGAAFEE